MLEKARLKGTSTRLFDFTVSARCGTALENPRDPYWHAGRGVEDAALLGTFDALSSVVRTEGRSDGGLADGDGARVVEEWYAFARLFCDDAGPATQLMLVCESTSISRALCCVGADIEVEG